RLGKLGRPLLTSLGPIFFHSLAQAFQPLTLDRTLEIFEGAVDVVVASQQFLESSQILGRGQSKPVQPVDGVATLFLSELFPLGDTLQILDTFLQTLLLLFGKRDNGVAYAALQVGELRVEVGSVFVEVLFAEALGQSAQVFTQFAAQFARHAGVGQCLDVTAMGLQVPQSGVEPVVEGPLYFEGPLEVVVNGGSFCAQPLWGVGGISEQDVGNVLIQGADAIAARQAEATELFGQGAIVVLEARKMLRRRLADLLFQRDDHVTDQLGESLSGAPERFDGRALVTQRDTDLLEGVV